MTGRRRIRVLRRCGAGLLLGLAWLLLGAGPAAGHSELESSDPAEGAVLDELPEEVRLTFAVPVLLDGATVELAASGVTAPLTAIVLDPTGSVLTALAPEGTALEGAVTIHWSVVSRDGHPISGAIGIAVGSGPAAPNVQAPALGDTALVERLFTADRLVGYLGLTILVGGAAFVVGVWPAGADVGRTRWLLWAAWGAAMASSLGGLALQAATVRGSELTEAVDPDALRSVLDSPFGRGWGARALLLLLAVPVLTSLGRWGQAVVRRPWFVLAGAAVGVGLLRTLALVGHATEGDLGALGAFADLVHMAGVATWLGGLVVLATVVLPRRRTAELGHVVPAFSRVALGSMVAIVAGGAVMAWDLAGSFDDLGGTEWGRLLLLKVALFIVALLAAQLSKRWVYERLGLAVALRGNLVLVRPFVLSVAAETLLAASILGVASALVTTSPGR